MDEKEIRFLLYDAISKPLAFELPFIAPSRTEAGREHLGKQRRIEDFQPHVYRYVYDHYVNVLGWLPANPNRPGLPEAMESIFIFAKSDGKGPYNFFNMKEGYASFITEITDTTRTDPIFMVGPKGSGKTFFQNLIFNTKTKMLYDNNVIWYRAECSKLYRKNAGLKSTMSRVDYAKSKMSLEDYLAAHIVFVSFKYRYSNPLFIDMWTNKDSIINDIVVDKYYVELFDHNRNDDLQPDMFIQEFLNFFDKASIEEETLANYLELHKDTIFQLLGPEWQLKSKFIANVILTYLGIKGFLPLFVLDGLDNCDYHDDAEEYMALLSEVKEFALKDDKNKRYPRKVIISCREETFNHIQAQNAVYFRRTPFRVYYPKQIETKLLIDTKVNMAVYPKNNYFITSKESALVKIDQYLTILEHKTDRQAIVNENDKRLREFAEKYPRALLEAIDISAEKFGKNDYLNENNFADIMYNGNYRAYINSFLNNFVYYRLFHSQRQQISSDKHYIFTEGQLLNGALYLDSEHREFELGKCIPNIFYFKMGTNIDSWHGLCFFRILQLLRVNNYSESLLIKKIRSFFPYNKDTIQERFRKALSHGLIKSNYDLNTITYSLTRKSEFLMDYILSDINFIYYCALDTPLSKYGTDRSNLIRFHSNIPMCWESYTEGCILTAITMMRHIISANKKELAGKKKQTLSIFKMPDFFPSSIVDGMLKHLLSLRNRDIRRFKELENDIKGIV